MNSQSILDANAKNYQDLYIQGQAFLRWPADWIIRFHNMFLRKHLPSGRVLDYGCGGGNNSLLFIRNGYDVYGVDVAPAAKGLFLTNLKENHLDASLVERFSLISPYSSSLPYEDKFFDVILSNQVLYYLPSLEHIKKVCEELSRCLRDNGVVFFTMMLLHHRTYRARSRSKGSRNCDQG